MLSAWERFVMAEEESDLGRLDTPLASTFSKETQSYLERGRRLQGLTDAQLASKWIVDFKAWRTSRADQNDPGNSAELEDTAAELRLRDVPPPYDRVEDDIKAIIAEFERGGARDPAVSAKIRGMLGGRGGDRI
jgi:hypothetical protein